MQRVGISSAANQSVPALGSHQGWLPSNSYQASWFTYSGRTHRADPLIRIVRISSNSSLFGVYISPKAYKVYRTTPNSLLTLWLLMYNKFAGCLQNTKNIDGGIEPGNKARLTVKCNQAADDHLSVVFTYLSMLNQFLDNLLILFHYDQSDQDMFPPN